MNEEKSSATAWLEKALRDFEASKRLISGDTPLLDSGVFHAQQAGEKALKGFLTNGGKPFPKTHDLGILLDLALQLEPTLESAATALFCPHTLCR